MASREHYLAEFERVAPRLPGPAGRRRSAIERFAANGLPTPAQEDWKYTDLKPLEKTLFATVGAPVPAQLCESHRVAGLDADRLVFVGGRFDPTLSEIGALPTGVTLVPLSQVMDRPELAPALDEAGGGAVLDLNTAFMTDGLYLHVSTGVAPARPIHVLYLGAGEAVCALRNLIRLERNAEATVIEHYAGSEAASYLTSVVTQADIEADARLSRCRVQNESRSAYHLGATLVRQARGSRAHLHSADLGGRISRHDTQVRLEGEHAEVDLQGMYAPGARQHIDNHTRVDHLQPHGRSRELFKGVLIDNGRGVFNGRIVVHKGAQKTDSAQSSAALLLSKGAEVDAKPELEIYADDVKCSHGATVGQLDENAVFYLRSRGVDEIGARNILTYSFADDVISRVGIEALRRHLETQFLAALPQAAQLRELL